MKDFSFSFMESVVKEMTHRGVPEEMLSQNLTCRSLQNTFMLAFIEKILKNSGFIAPFSAYFKQLEVNAIEKKLNQEPTVRMKSSPPLGRSPSVFAGTTLNLKSNARRSRGKRHDQKHRRHCNHMMEAHNKRKNIDVYNRRIPRRKIASGFRHLGYLTRALESAQRAAVQTDASAILALTRKNLEALHPRRRHFKNAIYYCTFLMVITLTNNDRMVSKYVRKRKSA